MRHAASALIFLVAALRPVSGEPVTGTPATISAPDGLKLAVTYYSGDRPGPGVLLLHQCNKDQSSWSALAEKLARAGFHVLTLDYRGYGKSSGKRHVDLPADEMVRLTTDVWPGDVDAAFAYLRAQPGVQQVYGAGGASCGVNQSIQLSHRHPEVKSLVLLSGNTDRAGRQDLASKSSPPLMIAASDDDGAVVEMMAWIDAASGNPTNRFVEYETGGHGTVLFGPHPELPGEIVAWYEATLSGRGKPASTPNQARRDSPRVRILMMSDQPGGFARALEALTAERGKNPGSPALAAPFVNFLGYQAIQSGDPKSAIAIMQVNVDARPASSNAWDSLADACLADGQVARAREASEKSLTLVDSDPNEPPDQRKVIRESAQGRLDRLKPTPPPK
ncbi:MAG TPA: alpha/beta fold hydrolase [Thermoanaerobaculia bacterium]|jgi:dienelactone hydrolase|nr:alpha/beta fold hydrolase [Thermoanaerobaculia bacterium]